MVSLLSYKTKLYCGHELRGQPLLRHYFLCNICNMSALVTVELWWQITIKL